MTSKRIFDQAYDAIVRMAVTPDAAFRRQVVDQMKAAVDEPPAIRAWVEAIQRARAEGYMHPDVAHYLITFASSMAVGGLEATDAEYLAVTALQEALDEEFCPDPESEEPMPAEVHAEWVRRYELLEDRLRQRVDLLETALLREWGENDLADFLMADDDADFVTPSERGMALLYGEPVWGSEEPEPIWVALAPRGRTFSASIRSDPDDSGDAPK